MWRLSTGLKDPARWQPIPDGDVKGFTYHGTSISG